MVMTPSTSRVSLVTSAVHSLGIGGLLVAATFAGGMLGGCTQGTVVTDAPPLTGTPSCGAIGQLCCNGTSCNSGVCDASSGQAVCVVNSTVNPGPSTCGVTGQACCFPAVDGGVSSGAGQCNDGSMCNGFNCVAGGPAPMNCGTFPGESCCPDSTCGGAGLGCCGGVCFDTQSDRNNCGGCGIVCAGSDPCTAGSCPAAPTCGESGQLCCANNVCNGALSCTGGTCQAAVACGAQGQTCCSMGSPCQGALTCEGGTCIMQSTGGGGGGGCNIPCFEIGGLCICI